MSAGPFPSPALVMAADFVNIGVNIPFSVRFDIPSATFQSRTMADSDGTKWTYSFWMKRGDINDPGEGEPQRTIFSAGVDASNYTRLYLHGNGGLVLLQVVGGSIVTDRQTDAWFRDPTSWYHMVVQYDSNQALAVDRVKFTVNGNLKIRDQVENDIELGRNTDINENVLHEIGRRVIFSDRPFDGLFAEMNFIDGLSQPATEFGKFNKQGHWIPKRYTGAYGTNGFRFDYANNTDFGNDVSGNANDFTDSGFTTSDQQVDSPTDNAASFNPTERLSFPPTPISFTEANLKVTTTIASYKSAYSTQWANRRKWYWEVIADNVATEENVMVGWLQFPGTVDAQIGSDNFGWALQFQTADNTADVIHNGVVLATLTPAHDLVSGDRIGMAIDIDAGKIWWRINGVYIGGGDPATGTGANVTDASITGLDGRFGVSINASGNDCTGVFDKDTILGSLPVGFRTFQVSSLPRSTYAPIPKASDFFDILLYDGDGVSEAVGGQAITGLDFAPNFVWVKARQSLLNQPHAWADTVRGIETFVEPDNGVPRTDDIEAIISFDSAGFTVGSNQRYNQSPTGTYVAWCWKRGIIPGMDIITYAGNDTAGRTLSHNLGAPPDLVMIKNLGNNGSEFGAVYMSNILDASGIPVPDPETDYIPLGELTAIVDDNTIWNDTAPTSSVITIGDSDRVNDGLDTYICYAFREIEGFSKFGSFVGASSLSSTFIWTGFRPKFFVVKGIGISNWQVKDTARGGRHIPAFPDVFGPGEGNANNQTMFIDVVTSETGGRLMDFLSCGFKMRASNVGNFIYWAFAEHPFKYARAQ